MGSWGLAAMTAAHPWARGPPMSSLTYMASLPVTEAIVTMRGQSPAFLGNSPAWGLGQLLAWRLPLFFSCHVAARLPPQQSERQAAGLPD